MNKVSNSILFSFLVNCKWSGCMEIENKQSQNIIYTANLAHDTKWTWNGPYSFVSSATPFPTNFVQLSKVTIKDPSCLVYGRLQFSFNSYMVRLRTQQSSIHLK